MRDAVIVEAVRTPIAEGKPTGVPSGVDPVDSISRDVNAVLGADLTALYPQLRRQASRNNVVRRHAR